MPRTSTGLRASLPRRDLDVGGTASAALPVVDIQGNGDPGTNDRHAQSETADSDFARRHGNLYTHLRAVRGEFQVHSLPPCWTKGGAECQIWT